MSDVSLAFFNPTAFLAVAMPLTPFPTIHLPMHALHRPTSRTKEGWPPHRAASASVVDRRSSYDSSEGPRPT